MLALSAIEIVAHYAAEPVHLCENSSYAEFASVILRYAVKFQA